MEFRLSAQLKQSQQLVMTPQLQMAIKLLALSRLELIDQVNAELTENPILEDSGDPALGGDWREADAASTPSIDKLAEIESRSESLPTSHEERSAMDQTRTEEYWEKFLDAYRDQAPMPTTSRLNTDDLPSIDQTLSRRGTLADHLERQIALSDFNEEERAFAMLVVHNLDDNGYLTLRGVAREKREAEVDAATRIAQADLDAPVTEVRAADTKSSDDEEIDEEDALTTTIEDLAREVGLDPEDAGEVLRLIQNMDPVGVAARDLRECLLVQVEQFGYDEDDIVWQVIDHHLPNVERRNFGAIARELKCELTDVYEAAKLLQGLEPRPGRNFTSEDAPAITPDVYAVSYTHLTLPTKRIV